MLVRISWRPNWRMNSMPQKPPFQAPSCKWCSNWYPTEIRRMRCSEPYAFKRALAQAAPRLSDHSLFAVGRTHLNGFQHRDGRFLRQTEHVGASLLGEPAEELVVLAKVTIPHISCPALPLLLPTFALADPTDRHIRQGRLIFTAVEIEM